MVVGPHYHSFRAVWRSAHIRAIVAARSFHLYYFLRTMEKLKLIFASVLGVSPEAITAELSPATTPAWDSLNAIVLITEIEKAFATRFEYDEAMKVKNFGDVITLLKSKGITLHD